MQRKAFFKEQWNLYITEADLDELHGFGFSELLMI